LQRHVIIFPLFILFILGIINFSVIGIFLVTTKSIKCQFNWRSPYSLANPNRMVMQQKENCIVETIVEKKAKTRLRQRIARKIEETKGKW
jgi:hypothetical protein